MMTIHSLTRRSAVVFAAVLVLLGGTEAARLLADEPKPVTRPADPPNEKKTDKELMQGDWVFDSAEAVGGSNGIHQAWQSVVTFDGDKLTVTKYQGFDWKTTFTLDPTESPKRFDMTVNELAKKALGFKDGTIKGIYRFDGEALEMCLAATPDDQRPKEFKAAAGLKQFRFTLKRKAKDFDPAKVTEFTVKVVDGDGKPVEGAVVCQYLYISRSNVTLVDGTGKRSVEEGWSQDFIPQLPLTNRMGETVFDPATSGKARTPNGILYARHLKRKLVALEPISPARIMTGVTLTLRPEAKLSGNVVCPNGIDPGPTQVYLCAYRTLYVAAHISHNSKFEFFVPAGDYHLLTRGDYLSEEVAKGENGYPTLANTVPVSVGPEGKEFKLEAKPTKVAELRGKPAPDLGEMAAWKGDAVKLADLKGKVVLLKFFTAGEMTDIVHSMPALVEHHTHYAGKGLVVVGVHYPAAFNEQITTVKQLDARLADIRTKDWPKEVPFPVALMKSQDAPAAKAYGLGSLPILIDKKGKVVGYYDPSTQREEELNRLEKLLDEK